MHAQIQRTSMSKIASKLWGIERRKWRYVPSMTILKDALKNKTRLKQFPSLLDGKSYYLHNRSGKHKVNNSKTFKPENSKMAFQASQLSLLLWGCIYYKKQSAIKSIYLVNTHNSRKESSLTRLQLCKYWSLYSVHKVWSRSFFFSGFLWNYSTYYERAFNL